MLEISGTQGDSLAHHSAHLTTFALRSGADRVSYPKIEVILPAEPKNKSERRAFPVLALDKRHPLQFEHAFRHLVENVRDYAIFMLTPEGTVVSWNPGAQQINQYEPDEIIGKHFSIFYPQEDVAADKPGMELRIAAETGRYEEEGWRLRKDGSRFWASVLITAVRDERGNLLGFGKIARDLTEQREAELRYRLLIEGVTDYAIYSLDTNGNITTWNTGAQKLKGYSAEEVLGTHFSRFYTPEDIAAGLPQRVLEATVAAGHYEAEGWRVRKDGTRFWSSVVVTALRNDAGELLGFSKITRDMTERKELLDKIQRHAEELELRIAEREQTNAELEAFSYSVSHDLRAPLRAIEGYTDIVLTDFGGQLPLQVVEYLRNVVQATGRMNRLIQDLLTYSRLTRLEIHPEPVKISAAIEGALAQIDLRDNVTIAVDPKLSVHAHLPTLTQVLFNLINNGLKFYPSGVTPKVEVAARCEGRNVVISVRDHGIGIAAQHQERIFQVFERLHTADAYPGTGIGLAIVRRGVARMGGTVRVESAPGKGSTFYVSLPAA